MTMSKHLLLAMLEASVLGNTDNFFGPVRSKEQPRPEPKPRPSTVNYLCGECEFLSPTEKKQYHKKESHMCTKYDEQVFHFGAQPKIFRCNKCLEVCNNCVGRFAGPTQPQTMRRQAID